jgi:predicted O-linked N-acetylglucosamine transferase (SPINDLY family)
MKLDRDAMEFLQRIVRSLRAKAPAVDATAALEQAQQLIEQGNAAEQAGQADQARRCYEAATAAAPRLGKAHMNLGNALLAAGAAERALAAYRTAVELDPESAPAHYNLGNALWHLNQPDAALQSYRRAAQLDPAFAHPWIAIANTLGGLGRLDEAIEACRRAIEVDPRSAEAHFVLSIVQRAAGRLDDMVESLRNALALRPDHRFALANLAGFLEESLLFDEALVHYRKLAELEPDSVDAQTRMLHRIALSSSAEPESLFREHVRVGAELERSERERRKPHANPRDDERVLRVGFVSADLTNHAVSYFVEPIFRGIAQRQDLALFCYHNNAVVSETTQRLRAYFLHWKVVDRLDDAALEALIRSDGIDILIDLSGYTEGNRLRLFARKPAPIQASWIGYPGTTGMAAVDYYFADRKFLPAETFAAQFVEKLVYLPTTSMFEPSRLLPAVNALPALQREQFTFGSFNRAAKLNRKMVGVWSQLLRAVPGSRLVIGAMTDERQIATLKSWFAEDGVELARLTFKPRSDTNTYLSMYHEVDLGIDTHPYSGGTTTHHALLMGVPVLTLVGDTPAGRQGASLMAQLALDGFVAASPEEYVRIGADWAQRRSELAQVRAGLRARIEASPIQDVDLMARAFAQAARTMWRRWCAGLPAEAIDVSHPE